jgi:hypothetical protein
MNFSENSSRAIFNYFQYNRQDIVLESFTRQWLPTESVPKDITKTCIHERTLRRQKNTRHRFSGQVVFHSMLDMHVCITITFIFPMALGDDVLVDFLNDAIVITYLSGHICLNATVIDWVCPTRLSTNCWTDPVNRLSDRPSEFLEILQSAG